MTASNRRAEDVARRAREKRDARRAVEDAARAMNETRKTFMEQRIVGTMKHVAKAFEEQGFSTSISETESASNRRLATAKVGDVKMAVHITFEKVRPVSIKFERRPGATGESSRSVRDLSDEEISKFVDDEFTTYLDSTLAK